LERFKAESKRNRSAASAARHLLSLKSN